jgi:O-antigen/teichoic acid export membrane protein
LQSEICRDNPALKDKGIRLTSFLRQFAHNVTTSWLGYGIRIVIGFFFVPYITTSLGIERYGAWVIVFQTINYFSLFDFGLERAVVRFVARFSALRDNNSISNVLSTAISSYLWLGTLVLTATFALSGFLFEHIGIANPGLANDTRWAFVVVGGFLSVRFYLSSWNQTLIGLQRSDIVNSLDIIEEIVRVLVLTLMLSKGCNLVTLAGGVFGVSLARQLGACLFVSYLYPEIVLSSAHVNQATRKSLFAYGGIAVAINATWLIVFGTDSILLGILSSTSAAGIFGPAAQVMLYLRNAVNAIGTPLVPAVAHIESQSSIGAVARNYIKALKYTAFASAFFSVGVIFFAKPFVQLWLAPEYSQTAEIMIILAGGTAFLLPQIIGNAVLFGIDKHKYLLVALSIEATLKLGLSFILIRRYGAVGMAWATTISQVATCLTIYPFMMSKALSIPYGRLLLTFCKFAFLSLIITGITAFTFGKLLVPVNWWLMISEITVVTLITSLIGYRFILEPQDKDRILQFIHR